MARDKMESDYNEKGLDAKEESKMVSSASAGAETSEKTKAATAAAAVEKTMEEEVEAAKLNDLLRVASWGSTKFSSDRRKQPIAGGGIDFLDERVFNRYKEAKAQEPLMVTHSLFQTFLRFLGALLHLVSGGILAYRGGKISPDRIPPSRKFNIVMTEKGLAELREKGSLTIQKDGHTLMLKASKDMIPGENPPSVKASQIFIDGKVYDFDTLQNEYMEKFGEHEADKIMSSLADFASNIFTPEDYAQEHAQHIEMAHGRTVAAVSETVEAGLDGKRVDMEDSGFKPMWQRQQEGVQEIPEPVAEKPLSDPEVRNTQVFGRSLRDGKPVAVVEDLVDNDFARGNGSAYKGLSPEELEERRAILESGMSGNTPSDNLLDSPEVAQPVEPQLSSLTPEEQTDKEFLEAACAEIQGRNSGNRELTEEEKMAAVRERFSQGNGATSSMHASLADRS